MRNLRRAPYVISILLFVFSIPLHADEIGKGVRITDPGHAAFKIVQG